MATLEPSVSTTPLPRRHTFRFGALLLLLLGAAALLAAAPAAAHECEANTHDGCDGHDCDSSPMSPGPHKHKTVHKWWWDHWCKSADYNNGCSTATLAEARDEFLCGGGSGLLLEGPLNALDPPDIDRLIYLAVEARRLDSLAVA